MKYCNLRTVFSAGVAIALVSLVTAPSAHAETCYFNGNNPMMCISNWIYSGNKATVKINWADGIKETYRFYGYDGSNASLGIATDPRGGRWQFVDRRDGCNWELRHISNLNIIRVSKCR